MDGTPKLQRKSSLSLTTRLNQKRHSASPQSRLKTSTTNRDLNSDALQRSPSVISIYSDGGIECTPPHKKMMMNLDDSLEYSPKVFDSSFSPTCLLSQTLAIDSPEVGWKWSRYGVNSGDGAGVGRRCIEDNSTRTPDSAYAADSSFASVGSSSTEVGNSNTGGVSYNRNANDVRREGQRKLMEQELRRVEKTRAEEKLKQRCAKLQEQIKSAGTHNIKTNSKLNEEIYKANSKNTPNCSYLNDVEIRSQTTITSSSTNSVVKFQTPEKHKKPELLNDFFNDTDSDCFLLEATQEIESKMETKTQPSYSNFARTTPKSSNSSECSSLPHANSAPAATTTPPSKKTVVPIEKTSSSKNESKDKRPSFYMKFLEDDCPDDWFVSLDEVILQATQTTKPRTSLQRYKSMPAETVTNSKISLNNKYNNVGGIMDSKNNSTKRLLNPEDAAPSTSALSKMKRHSSTHSLSPTGTNYRSRRQL